MRFAATALAVSISISVSVSLSWTACSAAGPTPPAPIETAKTFSLRVGESAQARAGILRVGFEGVTADSRCPKGEHCVWAGDATARIWLQRGSGPAETRDLHTAPGAAQRASAFDHEVQLVRLEPYPSAGQAVAKGDYVATLRLSRGSSAEPDR